MAKDGVTIIRAAEEDMTKYGHVNSRNKRHMYKPLNMNYLDK